MSDSTPARRRSIIRPNFDPKDQPWQVADGGLLRVNPELLTPDALRGALRPAREWTLDPLGMEKDRYPGREGPPVLAAVLIPMVMRPEGVRVMLTQRAAHLHDHAGQISFPGGRVELVDPTPVDTALREAQEETGLPQDRVEVLNSMPEYLTSTGFSITPVVSLVRPDFAPAPDVFEVADIFEVPLDFLMDPSNHRLYEARLPDGRVRRYYAIPWGERFIWGATAGMLRNLYKSLAPR
ncbi:CoA pyrophosphatase [Bordetella pseudohinzii]|uniref:Putative NUDIX hydrolase n=1 Tax=Bordetella pseudohinzii TaxID=1331258 RepID=A0A0M7DQ35_9BORD|nr:CoA pyrophosphatase [Bordetella pseudohinzii]CUI55714.1 putative NUDIX hydrolase [Bordetella pseudohinzii]